MGTFQKRSFIEALQFSIVEPSICCNNSRDRHFIIWNTVILSFIHIALTRCMGYSQLPCQLPCTCVLLGSSHFAHSDIADQVRSSHLVWEGGCRASKKTIVPRPKRLFKLQETSDTQPKLLFVPCRGGKPSSFCKGQDVDHVMYIDCCFARLSSWMVLEETDRILLGVGIEQASPDISLAQRRQYIRVLNKTPVCQRR